MRKSQQSKGIGSKLQNGIKPNRKYCEKKKTNNKNIYRLKKNIQQRINNIYYFEVNQSKTTIKYQTFNKHLIIAF